MTCYRLRNPRFRLTYNESLCILNHQCFLEWFKRLHECPVCRKSYREDLASAVSEDEIVTPAPPRPGHEISQEKCWKHQDFARTLPASEATTLLAQEVMRLGRPGNAEGCEIWWMPDM